MPTPTPHQNQPPSHNRKSVRFDGPFATVSAILAAAVSTVSTAISNATAATAVAVVSVSVVAIVAVATATTAVATTTAVVAVASAAKTIRSSGAARWSRSLLKAHERGRGCRLALAGWMRSRTRFGRRIVVLAALMAPAARCRWLELVAESLHDFDAAEHPGLLRDFRRHAVMVILRSWTVDFVRSRAS